MKLIIEEPEIIEKFRNNDKDDHRDWLKPYYNDDGNLEIELNKNAQKEILEKILKFHLTILKINSIILLME